MLTVAPPRAKPRAGAWQGSSAIPNLPNLTCVRALLAIWVFGYHIALQLGLGHVWAAAVWRRGYLGVDGFFVLSGIVLGHAYPDGVGGGWARFWLRRLARVYPVHLATLGLLAMIVAVATALGRVPRDPSRFGGSEFLRHLLLIHGWGASDRWAWNYPSWSVSTEWAGYLAFPALWFVVRRLPARAGPLLLGICLVGIWRADRGGAVGLNLTYQGSFERYVPEFVAGLVIARARIAMTLIGAAPWAVATAGLLAGTLPTSPDWLVVAALAAAIWLLSARDPAAPPILNGLPALRRLGEISYAFYMSFALSELSLAAIWRARGLMPPDTPAAYTLCATTTTLGLALILFHGVERPARRLGTRVSHAPRRR